MDSDDTPGSPRKKPKLEEPFSISSAMDLSDAAAEMVTIDGNPTPKFTRMDTSAETKEQHRTPETSHHTYVPTSNISNDPILGTKAVRTTIDPAVDQVNKERACGIAEFVSSSVLGFSGVLKRRYTDFLVNEILPSGEVVHLTSLRAPKKEQPRLEATKRAPMEPKVEGNDAEKTESPQKASRKVGEDTESVKESFGTQAASAIGAEEDKGRDTNPERACQQVPRQENTKHEETPLPHEPIVLPHLAAVPYTDTSPKRSPTNETRTRQQFHLRHTDQGWAEFEEEKAETGRQTTKEAKTTVNAPAGPEPTSTPPKKVDLLSQEDHPPAAGVEQPQTDKSSNTSPQAKWQAYANLSGESPTAHKITDEDKKILLSYFTEPVVNAVYSIYNRVLNSPRRATRDYGTVRSTIIDRKLRTKIHQDIRRIFQSRLETVTDSDGAMVISAMPPPVNGHKSRAALGHNERNQTATRGNHQSSKGHSNSFRKPDWHELGGDFLHFTLYKVNKDTMECISWLAKVLKLGPRAFEFAGTKDRRAVSVQRVSVYRQHISPMIDAGRSLRQAYIGDFEYHPRALQLGELTGNEFTITLRDCMFHKTKTTRVDLNEARSIVSDALENLVARGFINYYGLQRFGTFSISTADVGVKLLRGDFKGATEAILHYTPESIGTPEGLIPAEDRMSRDDKARSHAIHAFRTTGKAQRALADLPKKFSAESAIIRHLGNKPNQAHDYLGAIQSIQRNLRLMYVHAYQSLVWNMAASKRWSLYGDSVVEGDLVLINEHTNDGQAPLKAEDVDADGEVVVRPAAEDRATNVEDLFTRARALSRVEAESGKYTIFDIVLPTPGFDILYPTNEMAQFYIEFMASPGGGGLDPHNMRRPQKDFSLSGSYRKVLAKPSNESSFEIKTYDDDDEQFVGTDMDRLNRARDAARITQDSVKGDSTSARPRAVGEQLGKYLGRNNLDGDDTMADSDDDADSSGGVSLKKIAVVLKLQLGTSQYATMALRELMKAGGVKSYKPDYSGGR